MKKMSLKSVLLVSLSAVMLVGCSNWKKMAKDYYTVSPNPLEVKGGKVNVDVKGQFPAKVFTKNAALELTPELVYASGKTPLKSVTYQGENFPGNNTVIPYATGQSVSYSDAVNYQPAMEQSALWVKVKGLKGKSSKDLGSIKVADGVITTELLVQNDFKAALAPSNFVRDVEATHSGLVHFLVNSSVVRPAQLKTASYTALVAFVKQAATNPKQRINSIDFVGHASPEGEATLNENLSIDRAKAVEKYVQEVVKKAKVQGADAAGFYSEKGEGADWNGFFDLLANSSMTDKDMIKRTLDGEPLLATKEKTLKSLESTYPEIRNNILPELRRTEIKVNYTIIGKTDAQILDLAKTNPSELTANEILHAASLTTNVDEQFDFYKKAANLFPADYRGYNNQAVILWEKGDKAAAKALFEKAYNVEANTVTKNNVGIVKASEGDNAAAMNLLKSSDVAQSAYNQGVINIKEGNYSAAVANMKGFNTLNAALAHILNGNQAAAISTLDAKGCDCALTNYLKAIAYARQGNNAAAKTALAAVAAKDPAMAAKAQKDLEFRNVK